MSSFFFRKFMPQTIDKYVYSSKNFWSYNKFPVQNSYFYHKITKKPLLIKKILINNHSAKHLYFNKIILVLCDCATMDEG